MRISSNPTKTGFMNDFKSMAQLTRYFHTAGVTGSIPVPSTTYERVGTNRGQIHFSPNAPNSIPCLRDGHAVDSNEA